jgi:hypothetical protein
LYNAAGLTSSAPWGRRSREVLRKKLAVLVAVALMAMMALAGPAFGQGPPSQASCVGQDASTFAREIEEITGGEFSNLGEFISTTGASEGRGFGEFVSERAQEEPC